MSIELRGDGGDFAEVWINGELAAKLCSDENDIGTAEKVCRGIALKLSIQFITDNGFQYDADTDLLTIPE
jgi:hypothetical protein